MKLGLRRNSINRASRQLDVLRGRRARLRRIQRAKNRLTRRIEVNLERKNRESTT